MSLGHPKPAGINSPPPPNPMSMQPPPCSYCGPKTAWIAVAPGIWDCWNCKCVRHIMTGASQSGLPPIGNASPMSICPQCSFANGNHSNICTTNVAHGATCGCQTCTMSATISKQFQSLIGKSVMRSFGYPLKQYKEELKIDIVFSGKKDCWCGSGADGGNLHYDWCQCSHNYKERS
jgi:hypothetical protein